jgi:elongation factor P
MHPQVGVIWSLSFDACRAPGSAAPNATRQLLPGLRAIVRVPATPLRTGWHVYQTSDIRKGLKIEIDNAPWVVVEFMFVKPGKGQAFTRTKIKNLITGNVIDRTYKSGENIAVADVEEHTMQYLYSDGEEFHFMNTESFEQVGISTKVVGSAADFLLEEQNAEVLFYKGLPVMVEVPNFVELEITHCEPGVKGNTAQGGTKPATLSTGATVNVPLFVEEGTWIKVDTRTKSYVERVKR